jgi:hypothetical protein
MQEREKIDWVCSMFKGEWGVVEGLVDGEEHGTRLMFQNGRESSCSLIGFNARSIFGLQLQQDYFCLAMRSGTF